MKPLLTLLYKGLRGACGVIVDGALVVATPLVEKNPAKTLSTRAPVVLSMTRVVVLSFAVTVLRQVWRSGVGGWPDATVSMAVVLALPIVGALERVQPAEVVSLAQTLIGRFGQGDVRRSWSAPAHQSTEPSKFDDHRNDVAALPREVRP